MRNYGERMGGGSQALRTSTSMLFHHQWCDVVSGVTFPKLRIGHARLNYDMARVETLTGLDSSGKSDRTRFEWALAVALMCTLLPAPLVALVFQCVYTPLPINP
jgi:hypothetical protein